ncbi:hypothetical protein L914_16096 [Phytophthora nicotianae]|uniref:Uncharacterized protein n=1 Tax=Phytophthora nicotianae TaxID=4792 RepID=W2IBP3_PHYNI|nr:hypothetical protein L916_16170 [Phytophthora nicotianae]ETM37341.1 hypothetical protein L914_16096 [Phytophthora nicotianae]
MPLLAACQHPLIQLAACAKPKSAWRQLPLQ